MSEFVTDDVWQRALLITACGIDPESAHSLLNRKRIEAACSFLRANMLTLGKGYSFHDAAEAGRDFLAGLTAAENMMSWMQMRQPSDFFLQKLQYRFPYRMRAEILQAVEALEGMQSICNEINEMNPEPIGGKNSKPYLHYAVNVAYEVWIDLCGNKTGKIKTFLEFARVSLEPSRANITNDAVSMSYRRHIKPRLQQARTEK